MPRIVSKESASCVPNSNRNWNIIIAFRVAVPYDGTHTIQEDDDGHNAHKFLHTR